MVRQQSAWHSSARPLSNGQLFFLPLSLLFVRSGRVFLCWRGNALACRCISIIGIIGRAIDTARTFSRVLRQGNDAESARLAAREMPKLMLVTVPVPCLTNLWSRAVNYRIKCHEKRTARGVSPISKPSGWYACANTLRNNDPSIVLANVKNDRPI